MGLTRTELAVRIGRDLTRAAAPDELEMFEAAAPAHRWSSRRWGEERDDPLGSGLEFVAPLLVPVALYLADKLVEYLVDVGGASVLARIRELLGRLVRLLGWRGGRTPSAPTSPALPPATVDLLRSQIMTAVDEVPLSPEQRCAVRGELERILAQWESVSGS